MDSLYSLLCYWAEWSVQNFPKATPLVSLEKLQEEIKEVEEILNSDGDTEYPEFQLPEEYADCILCLIHSASKAGITIEEIVASISRVTKRNYRRKWKLNPNNTYSHE